jgi:tetratricopeptide (TPR) repeat protein
MPPSTPKKIGKYDVVGLIAQGGMGVVYKALDPVLDRAVAIKMVTAAEGEHSDLQKRFFREAQFTASLRHPNIVTIYDLGDFDGTPYLVMEYLAGRSLQSLLEKHVLTLQQKINCIRQVCHGLQYAHTRKPSIIHRDIKPANVMVLDDAGVKIIDFGIARFGQARNTRTGYILGSYQYMSPEQIKNEELDPRTDLFSVGVVLYQVLTSRFPFEGSSIADTLEKISNSPPPPLRVRGESYPPALENVISRALAKRREERYQSAEELAFDLLQIEDQLKRGTVGDLLQEAESLMRQGDLERAKQELVRILEVDGRNRAAGEMMKRVQHALAREQGAKRAQNLYLEAQEALELNRVSDALACIEQALRLDTENPELQNLHRKILEKERIDQILARAERASAVDDLEAAQRAVAEALQLDPDSMRARSFRAIVESKLAERRSRYAKPSPPAWAPEKERASSHGDLDPVWSDMSLDLGLPAMLPPARAPQPIRSSAPDPVRDSPSRRPSPVPAEHSLPAPARPPAVMRSPEVPRTPVAPRAPEPPRAQSAPPRQPVKVPTTPHGNRPRAAKSEPIKPRPMADPAPPPRQPVAWGEDFLHIVEKQLALFLGPLAKVVVKNAAAQTADRKHFLEFAASNIKSPADRQAFLARNLNLLAAQAEHASDSSGAASGSRGLTPSEIDRAARLLAQYIGPLAGVLTRKAAQKARNVPELYQLLSEHVAAKAERTRFLYEALNPPA